MISTSLFKTLIVTTLIVLLIYFTQTLMMPIIFSALAAMFLHPLVRRLERLGLGLGVSSFLVVLISGSILAILFSYMVFESVQIVSELPTENAEKIVDQPIKNIDRKVDLNLNIYSAEINKVLTDLKTKAYELLPGVLQNINNSVLFLITCPIYIFFMLLCRSSIRKFYYTSFKTNNRHLANRILNQVELVYIHYLRGLLMVMVIVGTLTSIGLALLGIDYPIIIGALTGLLTLVPYIGVFISALIPIIIAFLTKDSMWYVLGVVGVYAVVQFVEGNIITPKIMGKQVGINPLMIILGIVIFGTIGGVIGMLLTVPILALIKTVAFYVPGWKPLRALLQVSR